LLSTFNGEDYLPALLASLKNQEREFILVWRDDGSMDRSRELVRNAGLPHVVECVHAEPGHNGGPVASFDLVTLKALQTDADYFLYCDQDDVWKPNKLTTMLRVADGQSPSGPALWHHDLRVVDAELQELHPSFWAYMKLETASHQLSDLLSRNAVTGCACMVNRELLQFAAPIPHDVVMHDWWLALIASASGTITAVPDALVDYRQHGSNTIGAKGFWHGLNPFTNWIEGWERGNAEYRSLFPQAHAAAQRCVALGITDKATSNTFAYFLSIPTASSIQKIKALRHLGLRRGNLLLWVVAAVRVLTTKVY